MSSDVNPGGGQPLNWNTHQRKSPIEQIDEPNDNNDDNGSTGDLNEVDREAEIQSLLSLKQELIETLTKHNEMLDGKVTAASKKTMIDDNNKLIAGLREVNTKAAPQPKLNQNEVTAQLKLLTRAVKTVQEDLKTVKRRQGIDMSKENPVVSDRANLEERLVIIEPGQRSYAEITTALKGCKLDEDKLRIDSVYTTKKNQVAVKTRTKEERDKLVQNCKEAGLNARNPKRRVCKFVLKRLPPGRDNNDLINSLLSRRKDTEKLVGSFKTEKSFIGKNGLKVLIFTVSSEAAELISADPDFYLELDRHRAQPYVNEIQCYKCYGFDHIAKNCTQNRVCGQCAEEHEEDSQNCPKEEGTHVCINCTKAGREGADTHTARSNLCPVKIENRKRLVDRLG